MSTSNTTKLSWRHLDITKRQREIILQLAAGWERTKIRLLYSLRPQQLDDEISYILDAYNAPNVRMLITLAYLDNAITLAEVLPFVVAELNGPRARSNNIND